MFTTYSHLKAEDNYRREVLRDQNRTGKRGRVGKAVAALVVAGVIALAACGTVGEPEAMVQSVNDIAPAGQPDVGRLGEILGAYDSPDIEFGGLDAPDWEPNWGAAGSLSPGGFSGPAHGPR